MEGSVTKKASKGEGKSSDGVKKPKLVIQNVVSTFFLGRKKLDLKEICARAKYLEFNPHKFAAATIRLKYPRTTALLFGSGNIVCTGAKCEKDSRYACRQTVNILQRTGLKVGFKSFKIQNIVGSVALPHPIDLVQLQKDYGPYCSYEPELFPGAVFRLRKPRIVFLLFRSGRLVVTGGRSEKQIHKFWEGFYFEILKQYLDKKDSLRCSSEYRYRNTDKKFTYQFFYDALK